MRKPFVLIALLLALALASPALSAPAPYDVDVIVSLTGSGSAIGTAEAESLRLLEVNVNKAGGIRGRPIAFAIHDDQSSPQVALQLANVAIAKKPTVLIGTSLVAGCSAILPMLSGGPVTYCLSAGMYPPKDSYMFAYGVPTREGIRQQFQFFHQHGWKRVAVIFTTDATGQDFERSVDSALALPENRDITLVARERFNVGDVSVTAQIARIKAAAPQALIAWGTGTPIGIVFHGMTDLGYDVPTAISPSNLNYNEMRQFNNIVPKTLYFVTVPGVAPDAVPKGRLREAAATYYNTLRAAGVPPDANHVISWDPGMILVNALRALGPDTTPARLKDYIERLHGFYGAAGEFDFRTGDQRGLDGRTNIVVRYDSAHQDFVAVQPIGSAISPK